ncbi:Hypothetical predicted protein [Cloeon dipterum]|uniref:Uncharacterized protein n=1 Tax=Cloeon dipterum TaxID=197152 RepID=A0A8S1DMF0_9INSE|nr:Hypothetical predicted protein [Cloeon dipterum]
MSGACSRRVVHHLPPAPVRECLSPFSGRRERDFEERRAKSACIKWPRATHKNNKKHSQGETFTPGSLGSRGAQVCHAVVGVERAQDRVSPAPLFEPRGLLPAPRTSVATALFGRPDGMRPPVVARDHSPCAGPSQKGVGIGQRGASGCPGGGQRPHQLRFLFHDSLTLLTRARMQPAVAQVLLWRATTAASTAAPKRPLAELQLHATSLAPDAEQTPSCRQPDAVVLPKPSHIVAAV